MGSNCLDIKINEICLLCKRPFNCLRTLISHSERCKTKNWGSQDGRQSHATEHVKRLSQKASKELNNQLKAAPDAKDASIYEESIESLDKEHREAADRCVTLCHENSLLERILVEKGKR